MASNNKKGKVPDFEGFCDELTLLSKKYGLWLYGERGMWLETEDISKTNINHSPVKYALSPSSSPKSVQFVNYE